MEHVVDRELLEDRCRREEQDHYKQDDPGDRVLDEAGCVVPRNDLRIVGDEPKSLRPRQNREQHEERQHPKDDLKGHKALYVLPEQAKRAQYALEPVQHAAPFRARLFM